MQTVSALCSVMPYCEASSSQLFPLCPALSFPCGSACTTRRWASPRRGLPGCGAVLCPSTPWYHLNKQRWCRKTGWSNPGWCVFENNFPARANDNDPGGQVGHST